MATNYIQPGDCLEITAAADIKSGDFVTQGKLGGVAVKDAASGETVVICLEGVYQLPKATGTAWTQGDTLYWDATNSVFTKSATGNTKFGVAASDAASADSLGQVRLDGVGA